MEQLSLRAQTGRAPGSRSSRRLRREGQVPAIVYGRDMEPINISVDAHDLYTALHTELGTNALINLEVDGGEDVLTLAREVTRHPFRPEYQHVDFVKVSLTEKVTTEVTLHFEGEAVGVREGGVFSPRRTSVHISALVTNIPGHIELDVSGVDIGESLRVSDLPVIEGVEYLDEAEAVLMSVTLPAAEIEEEAPEVEELEGEELEGFEGEVPEAGEEGEAPEEPGEAGEETE